jgi:hypothetical protein
MNFLRDVWQRIAWRLWGRRIAIRQVRKLISEGLPPPTPWEERKSVYEEMSVSVGPDDAGLN